MAVQEGFFYLSLIHLRRSLEAGNDDEDARYRVFSPVEIYIYMYIVHGGLILYVENSCSATNMTPRSLVLRGFSWLHTKHLCVERPISSSCVGSDFTNPDFLLFCIYPPHPPAHHLVGYPKNLTRGCTWHACYRCEADAGASEKKQTHSTMLLLWGCAVVWWVVYTWYPTLYID